MSINLHIERLVLHRILVEPYQRLLLQSAMEADLTRRLVSGGLSERLQSGGALHNVSTGIIQLKNNQIPAQLGRQIAGAVYGEIAK